MKYSSKAFVEELVHNRIITPDIANDIAAYYDQKHLGNDGSRLIGIFGVLGALLVSIGMILIVAHNWDQLSLNTKTAISVLPSIIGLGACAFTILKKPASFAWREGSTILFIFAFGASIAMISQIYNIPGSLKGFLLTWALATLPLIYIMQSRIGSLFYIMGVAAYGCHAGFEDYNSTWDYFGHWLLLAAIIPIYIQLLKTEANKNATYFHHWILPAAGLTMLWTIVQNANWWLLPTYFCSLALYYLLSAHERFQNLSLFANGYRIIGSIGMIGILLVWSFRELWMDLAKSDELFDSTQIIGITATTFLVLTCGYLLLHKSKIQKLNIMDFAFLVFPIIFLLGSYSPITATILTNIFILGMAVGTIYKGTQSNHLGIVNYGLLTIAALIICRFFDTNIPFIIRGLLFIGVGAAFFLVNYQMIKRRKSTTNS